MKKLTRFIAGFSAAAALLLGVGCTNQADYVEDNTARNACNIEGLYVEGLEKAYDGNVFELHAVVVNEKGEAKSITEASDGKVTDDTVAILTGTVADSYTKDSKTVGHKSGTIYKTIADNKRLFDGDSMAVAYQRSQIAAGKTGTDIKTFAAGTLEFYLKVGNDYVFGTKKNSAGNIVPLTQKLSIPTSPAGTSDAALQSRWVKVVIANGVPTATLEKKVDEPVNVTLANIKLDLKNVAKDKLSDFGTDAITCETVAKTGTNQKFTLKIKGLTGNDDMKVILSGSKISMDDSKVAAVDGWVYDKVTDGFVQTIKNGEVSWTFYGATPTQWTTYRTWGTSNETVGPEIQISDYNNGEGDNNTNPRLLESPTALGNSGDSFNFLFPKFAIGDYDVTLTIDKSKLKKENVTQADPVVAPAEIKINAIYVANLTGVTSSNIYYLTAANDDSSGRKFIDNVEKNGTIKETLNKWNPADAVKFISGTGAIAYKLSSAVNVKPGQSTFVLGFRAVVPKTGDATAFDWDAAGSKAFETPTLLTENYADGKEYTLYADGVTGVISLVLTSKVDFSKFPLKVNTLKVTGWTQSWVPGLTGDFNDFGNGVAMTAVTGETGSYKLDLASRTDLLPGKDFKFRNGDNWFPGGFDNCKWPDIFTSDTLNVTCAFDSDGKFTVTYAKAN